MKTGLTFISETLPKRAIISGKITSVKVKRSQAVIIFKLAEVFSRFSLEDIQEQVDFRMDVNFGTCTDKKKMFKNERLTIVFRPNSWSK